MSEQQVYISEPEATRSEPDLTAPAIQLKPLLTEVVNYALQQNRLPILAQVTLQNHTHQALERVTLSVSSTPELL